MRTSVGYLFFTSAVFLDFIELGLQVTLKELFPESDGNVYPEIKTFKYGCNPQLVNLRTNVRKKVIELDPNTNLIARDHVIIGWKNKGSIWPLSDSNGRTNVVFDRNTNEFVMLHKRELKDLGVGRLLSLVLEDDEAALESKRINQAIHEVSQRTNGQAYTQLDYHAIYGANHGVNHPAGHEVNYGLDPEVSGQAYNQLDYHAIYGANHGVNRPEVHAANHGADREVNRQAYNQVNYHSVHGVNHELNHPPIHQATPQVNTEANIQAYNAYQDYLRRHGFIQ